MTKEDFIDWLRKEMERREWSQSELARRSKLSPAQITRLLNGERGVGEAGLTAIAHALKLPPETVFRAAGILPPQTPENELIQQISYIAKDLPADEQEGLLEYAKLRQKLSQEKGENGKQPRRAAFPTPTQPK